MLYFSRQYDRAIEQFRAVLEVDPNFGRAHMSIFAYVQKGQFAEASAEIERWRKNDDNSWIPYLQTYVYARSGHEAQARQALQKLDQLKPRQAYSMQRAVAYTGVGDKDAAIAALQQAMPTTSPRLPRSRWTRFTIRCATIPGSRNCWAAFI